MNDFDPRTRFALISYLVLCTAALITAAVLVVSNGGIS